MRMSVVRCRGAFTTPVRVFRTRVAAFPIAGTEGSSSRGMNRGPGLGVGVAVGRGSGVEVGVAVG